MKTKRKLSTLSLKYNKEGAKGRALNTEFLKKEELCKTLPKARDGKTPKTKFKKNKKKTIEWESCAVTVVLQLFKIIF